MKITNIFNKKPKIGLALGGGGAKGLAHVPLFEVLDDMAVVPHMISGTSIGAILGAMYASGLSGKEIRNGIEELSWDDEDRISDVFLKKNVVKWFEFIELSIKSGGLLKVDKFISFLSDMIRVTDFEDLQIPLKVVAADFWERKQVVFDSGDLLGAVQASMALPAIFNPVVMDQTVLVDGGTVNPVPFDLLKDECDIVIGVNVMGKREEGEDLIPSYSEAIFNTFQIYQRAILDEKLKHNPPDILIEPDIVDIKVLDFFKADQVFEQAEPAKKQLKDELIRTLGLEENKP